MKDADEIGDLGAIDDIGGGNTVEADMRMSSGPFFWKEKPRSASSICIEETPISSTTPSSPPAGA